MVKEVEKFKLTKEQIGWSKDYEKKIKIFEMVKGKLMQQMAGARKLQELLGTLQQGLTRTLDLAPKKQTHEIEGQE